jgi:hypothetical protein
MGFVQNHTVIRKPSEIRVFSQTSRSFAKVIAGDGEWLENLLTKPCSRIRPKGNRQTNTSLACYFEQIVR